MTRDTQRQLIQLIMQLSANALKDATRENADPRTILDTLRAQIAMHLENY